MALVLTLRPGESMYVANQKFTLIRIVSEDKIKLVRDRDKKIFDVTVVEKVEIDDDVLVQLGDRMTTKAARIAIEADRSILILSQDKYLLMQKQKQQR